MVAEGRHSTNERVAAFELHFSAQATDGDVHGVGVHVVIFIPQTIHNHLPADDLAHIAGEQFQEEKLFFGEDALYAFSSDHSLVAVQRKVAQADFFVSFFHARRVLNQVFYKQRDFVDAQGFVHNNDLTGESVEFFILEKEGLHFTEKDQRQFWADVEEEGKQRFPVFHGERMRKKQRVRGGAPVLAQAAGTADQVLYVLPFQSIAKEGAVEQAGGDDEGVHGVGCQGPKTSERKIF